MDDKDFSSRAEKSLARLKQQLFDAEEEGNFEVEEQGGVLQIYFEDSGARFVISPNSAVRQIWISALATSFKLDWSDGEQDFVLAKTGERIAKLVGRLISEQTGEAVEL